MQESVYCFYGKVNAEQLADLRKDIKCCEGIKVSLTKITEKREDLIYSP